jgi:RHS repeat-associated protein
VAVDSQTLAATDRYYDPYGNPVGTPPSSWPGTKGFVGGTTDAAPGLTNLGAREYDPATSSFISPDPLVNPYDPQDLNAYATDDPATDSDPSGAMPCDGSVCGSWQWLEHYASEGDGTGAGTSRTTPAPSRPPSMSSGTRSRALATAARLAAPVATSTAASRPGRAFRSPRPRGRLRGVLMAVHTGGRAPFGVNDREPKARQAGRGDAAAGALGCLPPAVGRNPPLAAAGRSRV